MLLVVLGFPVVFGDVDLAELRGIFLVASTIDACSFVAQFCSSSMLLQVSLKVLKTGLEVELATNGGDDDDADDDVGNSDDCEEGETEEANCSSM